MASACGAANSIFSRYPLGFLVGVDHPYRSQTHLVVNSSTSQFVECAELLLQHTIVQWTRMCMLRSNVLGSPLLPPLSFYALHQRPYRLRHHRRWLSFLGSRSSLPVAIPNGEFTIHARHRVLSTAKNVLAIVLLGSITRIS